MELWHRLSSIVDFPEIRRQLDHQHEIWAADYDKLTTAQVAFVNKEINDFRRSIVSQGESLNDYHIPLTHMHEIA